MTGWKTVATVAVVVAGALGAFAIYTLGWHDGGEASHVITLREGDVVLRPGAATRCEASSEGGRPNLFCTRIGGGRHQVIFYPDAVLVWPLERGPDGPPISYLWTRYVLGASRDRQFLGRLELRSRRRSVTYADAIRAFGRPTSCRGAVAVWRRLGLRLRLATLRALPSGKGECEAPGVVYVHSATLTGRQWQTEKGLSVGLPAAVVRRLYPKAVFQRRPRADWPAPSYWLVSVRTPCVGSCSARQVTVPRLAAYLRAGRVAGFFFPVGAEGE